MKADIFYATAPGRALFRILQKAGLFHLASWFLHTGISKHMIPGYIERNGIDMKPFVGQTYRSFAAFFSRKRNDICVDRDPYTLVSPCDGMLSIYPVTDDLLIPVKGSLYEMTDLIPDKDIAAGFSRGLCLVFRLEASDYHHFCCFDDGSMIETGYISGQLHSVQPIAHKHVPVFRLNRRWWGIMETSHFGMAAQIEVGAVLVGGVSFFIGDSPFCRGDEMGCFELAGSSILLFLSSSVQKQFIPNEVYMPAVNGAAEVRVKMGSSIGVLRTARE